MRGFKGRLRGADTVEPEMEEIITRYLKKRFRSRWRPSESRACLRSRSIQEAAPPAAESDQVRDMLLTEEAGQQEVEAENSRPPAEIVTDAGASSGAAEHAVTGSGSAASSRVAPLKNPRRRTRKCSRP